jgi:diguanylate cyclase (GGDEF)-like protein
MALSEATTPTVSDADMLVRSGRIGDALAMAEAVWRHIEAGTDTPDKAECQRVMATAHGAAGRLREALVCGYQAIELYEQIDAPGGFSRMLSIQAVALVRNGDPGEALNLVQRAVGLAQRMDDPVASARVWNNVSVVYESLGQLAKAVEALETALPLVEASGESNLLAVCTCNLWLYRLSQARAAGQHGATDEALQALAAHMTACEASGRHHLVGSMADPAGAALADLGRLDQARATFMQGLRSAGQVGVGPDRARLELGLARVERLCGQHAAAAAHMATALDQAIAGDAKDVISQCHLEHSRLLEDQGDWRAALQSFKRHSEVHQAMLKAQAETAVQVVAVRMEAERTRLEAQLLQLRNAELERNVRELTSEAEQLAHDAQIDPLTGLGNRRQFQRRIGEIQAESDRLGGEAVVLLQADIDHFKRINDTWSHAVGDEVLRRIGALLLKHCRPYDAVARFGGEEFVVGFGGGVSLAQACAAAERLRARIAEHDWHTIRPGMAVTISIGIAQMRPGEDVETVLARADAALYEAKHGGRNQLRAA